MGGNDQLQVPQSCDARHSTVSDGGTAAEAACSPESDYEYGERTALMVELLTRPSLDRKAYRLKCRFKISPYPKVERLNREKVRVAEMFVSDMGKQGWAYVSKHGFTMKGPFSFVAPTTLHTPRALSAKDMLSGVMNGRRFRDDGGSVASLMPALNMTEWWEYELAGVFSRPQLMTEYPDLHEEEMGA